MCKHCAVDSVFVSGCGLEVKSAKVLLKKLYKHEQSLVHRYSVVKMNTASMKQIENCAQTAQTIFEQQNKQKIEVTARVFRTVYVKSCLPFSEVQRLISLREIMNYSAELTLNRRRGVKADPLGAFFSTA